MTNNQNPSLLDRIGSKFDEIKSDPNFKDNIVLAMQSLSHKPNQQMMQVAQQNIQDRKSNKLASEQANKTIEFLRAKGVPESELQSLQQNPQMLLAYAQAILKKTGSTGATPKSYAPKIDPKTGQMSVPVFNPNDSTTSYIPIEGARQLTPAELARLDTDERVYQNDLQAAKDAAREAMNQSSAIQSKLPLYQEIVRKIDEGADSGFIMSRLPALNEATASLRSAANQLGINVINSATFGALSAQELELALSTEIPQSLSPAELRSYVIKKYEAQAKLANEINKKARTLSSSGMTYSQYVNQITAQEIPTTIPNISASIDDADVEEIE